MEGAIARLRSLGYEPPLDPQRVGLYTFDPHGRRVRAAERPVQPADVEACPERFSPDAALRPLLADRVLPTVASILGLGEIAYHAMLRPVYALFDLPQPVCVPREGYTVLAAPEVQALARFGVRLEEVLSEGFDPGQAMERLFPTPLRERFNRVGRAVDADLAALRDPVSEIDPSLEEAWNATQGAASHALKRLEARAVRALAARQGLSAGLLQRIRNAVLPRGRPQERVFPLPHFINRHGPGVPARILSEGGLDGSFHGVMIWEEDDEDA